MLPKKKEISSFRFQQRYGRLDVRNLAKLDLDMIIRDVDLDAIQMHLETLTFCNLREDDLRNLTDPLVIKLFRLAQLTIEYLLHVQDELTHNLEFLTSKYALKKRCF